MPSEEKTVTVRPLKNSDIDAALNLAGRLITPAEMASLNTGDPAGSCFVAEADGEIVGFNLASELYVGIPLTKICVIQGIIVRDDFRRLGIGEKLVEAVFKQCADRGIEAVRTLVDENDLRLQRFVEHLGFRRSAVANFDRGIVGV